METTNPNIEGQAEALKAYQEDRRQKRKKLLIGTLVAVGILVLGYFGYKNQELFRAAITERATPGGTKTLFIPNYEAGVGDEGTLSVKARGSFSDRIHSIAFTLKYSPANALIFKEDSIVFDNQTLFQGADLQSVNTATPGQADISFFSNEGETRGAMGPQNLFKLRLRINPDLPAGTTITLTAQNVEVIVADPVEGFKTSETMTGIDTGVIALVTQADLRLLYAEAQDNTHVLLHFSDLLTSVGEVTDYNLNRVLTGGAALTVASAERGDKAGFSQDVVRLTVSALDAGSAYRLNVTDANRTIAGNAQGGIDTDYDQAFFFAPGAATEALSDFNLVSARATGPAAVDLTFSHPVEPASITPDDFEEIRLLPPPSGIPPVIRVTNVTMEGRVAHLVLDTPLLAWNTYLISIKNSPNDTAAPRRTGDGARLGIDIAALRGMTNGPQVTGAAFVDDDEDPATPSLLEITFDSDRLTPGSSGIYGTIHTTGTLDDVLQVGGTLRNVRIAGNVIRVTGFTGRPGTNYTFVGSSNITSGGVPLDSAHNSVTFWGAGHDDTQNTIGAVTIIGDNKIEIQPGTLNFSRAARSNMQLVAYLHPGNLLGDDAGEIAIGNNVSVVNGALRIETTKNLDPSLHYILVFLNPADPAKILRTADFVLSNNLDLVSAETVETNQVRVTFSENIEQGTVGENDFTFYPPLTPNTRDVEITVARVGADFKTVTLDLVAPTTAGKVYRVTAGDIRSFAGAKPMGLNTAVFTGHQTQAELSTVRVNSVESLSSTRARVTFSEAVNLASVTPVNVAFRNAADDTELTVTAVTPVNDRTFEFKTSAQTPDTNYFFVPLDFPNLRGVMDTAGRTLLSTRVLSFFGFQVPQSTVGGFTPTAITNETEHDIVIAGRNLNHIQSVRVGNTATVITDQPANGLSLTFRVPAGFSTDIYEVTLTDRADQSQTFQNALVVTEPERPMRVVSDASLATPFRVPNNGTTKITLRVLVEDPLDLANIDSVSIDLTLIGGAPSVEMQKATGTQPANRQWYVLSNITIPATIRTSAEPYLLPVEARKGAETVAGTASVHVTTDQVQSVAPAIPQAFFTPATVAPDGTTKVKISAQVTDADGSDTIASVVANLGTLGVGFAPLTEVQGVGSAAETVSRFYESAEFTIPRTTPLGSYQVTVTAQDASGETATATIPFMVSSTLTGPTISAENSYIAPRSSVPHDGATTFSLHAFVNDPDGMGDIASVTANFGALGIPPKALTRAAEATDAARSGYFTAEGLTIPATTSIGVRQITVAVTDKSGSSANHVFQIDVTDEDTLGEPPLILTDRAYTTPRVAVNDGETPVTLHVFVRDNDDDIESVLVNLTQVGQLGPARSAGFAELEEGDQGRNPAPSSAERGDSVCPTNSSTLVCFEPSVREGKEGQWFILPEVTITPGLPPQAYTVEVIATDASGKTSRQMIPIQVSSSAQAVSDAAPPVMVGAVATNANTLEVIFSEPLNPTTLSASGREFTIVSQSDINDALPLLGSTINADGNIVTITTEAQAPGKAYVLTGSQDIKDTVGVPLLSGAGSRTSFAGFAASDKPPVVEYIAAASADTIEIEFRDPLKPTSFGPEDIVIKTSGVAGANVLKVLGVKFLEGTNVVEVTTETQTPGERYRVSLQGLTSATGTAPTAQINKLIKGFKAVTSFGEQTGALRTSADLNGDNKVDFIDFTMFSAVYGTTLQSSAPPANPASTNPPAGGNQPIPPKPDATVSVTSPVDSSN